MFWLFFLKQTKKLKHAIAIQPTVIIIVYQLQSNLFQALFPSRLADLWKRCCETTWRHGQAPLKHCNLAPWKRTFKSRNRVQSAVPAHSVHSRRRRQFAWLPNDATSTPQHQPRQLRRCLRKTCLHNRNARKQFQRKFRIFLTANS